MTLCWHAIQIEANQPATDQAEFERQPVEEWHTGRRRAEGESITESDRRHSIMDTTEDGALAAPSGTEHHQRGGEFLSVLYEMGHDQC
jgi:hypothetical protein